MTSYLACFSLIRILLVIILGIEILYFLYTIDNNEFSAVFNRLMSTVLFEFLKLFPLPPDTHALEITSKRAR